jgi:hypothetical protein
MYALAWEACREKRIRSGEWEPETADEHRWAAEGPRPNARLDVVRE